MDQRVSLITLGVADVAISVRFYEALGWHVANDWREQKVAFFQCGGMIVGLWDATSLAADSCTPIHPPGAATLAYNVASPADVDATLAEAEAVGALIPRPGAATFWGGYSGVFHDPDGHPWEVAHNPHWTIRPDGSIALST